MYWRYNVTPMGYYDVAQICLNGHMINDHAQTRPQHNQEFCSKCAATTIIGCPQCDTPIRGYYEVEGVIDFSEEQVPVPAFCQHCSKAFPWTESRLEAAHDLAGQLELDVPDRTLLEKSIEEIVRDTPRAPAEAMRFKTIVEKAKPWGLKAFKEILYGIAGEAVKRMIWP